MNEVIDVTVGDDLEVSYFLSGQPVTVTGWIEVGEKKSEFGQIDPRPDIGTRCLA